MGKVKSRKVGLLDRDCDRSLAALCARALRLIAGKPLLESDLQTYPHKLPDPSMCYDEVRRVRLQLLEMEKQQTEAMYLVRHCTCT